MAAYSPSEFFRQLRVFVEPEHMPFRWEGGDAAALLVHGFPGTPADVRPLAQFLHSAGWTVEAPLLPGFGPDIATLPSRRYQEWVDAVACQVNLLKRRHSPVVVLGHSLGSAVSLVSSMQEQADGQVLLAPYWRFGQRVQHLMWPVMRPLLSRWRPLRGADFTDLRVRNGLLRMMPDLDLDDPTVQQELRRFVIPTPLLDELRGLGLAAFGAAARSNVRTLIVQGARDRLVRPDATRKLFLRLPAPATIELVDGTHNIHKPEDAAWTRVETAIARFTSSLLPPARGFGTSSHAGTI